MKYQIQHVHRRASLKGWWWWLLAMLPMLLVVFVDTWINTGNLHNDYEMAQVNKQLKELHETLDALKVEEASLRKLERIEIEAPDLGLVEPQPDQIQVIYTSTPIDTPLIRGVDTKSSGDAHGTFASRIERAVNGYLLNQRVGDVSWEANSASSLASVTPAGTLLKRAISSAYAYCVGDS